MPLLLLYLLFGTATPVQAQQYEVREYQQSIISQKYTRQEPCYKFIQRDFTEHTVCPIAYFIIFSDGYVLRVSPEQYAKQVVGYTYKK